MRGSTDRHVPLALLWSCIADVSTQVLLACLGFSIALAGGPFQNVDAFVKDRQIVVRYDLVAQTPTSVWLIASRDNDRNFDIPITSVHGDLGSSVSPGKGKEIRWKYTLDLPDKARIDDVSIEIVADIKLVQLYEYLDECSKNLSYAESEAAKADGWAREARDAEQLMHKRSREAKERHDNVYNDWQDRVSDGIRDRNVSVGEFRDLLNDRTRDHNRRVDQWSDAIDKERNVRSDASRNDAQTQGAARYLSQVQSEYERAVRALSAYLRKVRP